MPQEKGLDHTLSVLKEGYEFIVNRREQYDSNVFITKLLGEKTICLTGKKSAELFYNNEKFKRSGAAPKHVQKTLFGENGVQTLDGEEHHHRKAMFMSLMTKEALGEIASLMEKHLDSFAAQWETKEKVVVYDEAKQILTHVACEWTGVPLEDREVEKRSNQLAEMFESAASIGLGYWKGRGARTAGEEWIEDLVQKVRDGEINPPAHLALYQFSWHRDLKGDLLDKQIVAVELLNLLRPIVAISVYISFTVLAMIDHPDEVAKLKSGDEKNLQCFIQEVRRYYPFFPFAGARVMKNFTWNGFEFEEGTLTLLDLYGTNHHPEVWKDPEHFDPERFELWEGSPFDFIPQGGGEFDIGHRCAGEWLTLDLLKETLNYFVHHLSYNVPEQDLTYSMSEMPSLPKSGVQLTNIVRQSNV
ncbi:cytochrome P450 [Pseudalkalibacillus hwajinpoensis]|uniref:cytochrome P450 n=1 Tax=Guptibacillus hwajinpoensis TaxID=208199 RepID=UPI00325A6F3E